MLNKNTYQFRIFYSLQKFSQILQTQSAFSKVYLQLAAQFQTVIAIIYLDNFISSGSRAYIKSSDYGWHFLFKVFASVRKLWVSFLIPQLFPGLPGKQSLLTCKRLTLVITCFNISSFDILMFSFIVTELHSDKVNLLYKMTEFH